MDQKAGAQISQRAFIQSLVILFVLMMIAGILTLIIPARQYTRIETDGRETIDPNSFQFVAKPDYPIWRWFIAPLEVLGSSSGLTVIVIIIVLLFAGGFEFGTFGDSLPALIRSLRITILENQLRQ